MHGHHHDKHHMHEEFSGGEYGFATAADRDRFIGAMRGRGGGRGRGRGRGWGGDFGRHGGFGPRFGRGPRAGRGDVRAAILALLAEEPMHGYQIITELTERSRGVWRPSPGSVYPTLQVMEDQGLVTADKSEGRRVFTLTEAGRAEAEPGCRRIATLGRGGSSRRPLIGRPSRADGRGRRGDHAGRPDRLRPASQSSRRDPRPRPDVGSTWSSPRVSDPDH